MKMRAKIVWVLSVGVVGYLVLVMVFGTGIRTGLSPNDLGVCKIFHKFDESLSNGDWVADVDALPSFDNYQISEGQGAAIYAARGLKMVNQDELVGAATNADAIDALDMWITNYIAEFK